MDNYNYDPNNQDDNNSSGDGWKNPYENPNQNNYNNNANDNWSNPYANGNQDNFSSNRANKADGFAIASMVLGILSIPAILTVYFGFIFAVSAIVFAFISRSRTDRHMQGMAIAGLVTGIISIALIIFIIVIVVNLISSPEFSNIINQAISEYKTI